MVMYLLQLVAWTAFMAALILWPAGTLAYPGAGAFIAPASSRKDRGGPDCASALS
jgi:hypothetical protein